MTILVPASGPEAWKALLADPEKHWRTGYSAKCLAHSWSEADGMPDEIRSLLRRSALFESAEVLLAIPEHSVALPGIGKGSQNDLWALLRTPNALVSMTVEGKVSESFDQTVTEWLGEGSANKQARLNGLASILGLERVPGTIRYQLLHRTASAILEAQRFLAAHAIMLVHSFSDTSEWYEDFVAFVGSLAQSPRRTSFYRSPITRVHLCTSRGLPVSHAFASANLDQHSNER